MACTGKLRPDGSVIRINSVTQGAKTFTPDVDYKLTAQQVDWSPTGAEPTPGSSYNVTYEYISTEAVLNQTPRGFDVSGALVGSLILVDYRFALRRIDRIVMDGEGLINVVKGIPATWQPVPPAVPDSMLALGSIYQTWEADTRRTESDSVRMVPMATLVDYRRRMDDIEMDLAELRLATDTAGRYSGLKKGYFADPMKDDSMRDQGIEQTALVTGGALQLYEAEAAHMLGDGRTTHALEYSLVPVIRQTSVSRSMLVNGLAVAGDMPATVTLIPAVDRWEHPQELRYPKEVILNFGHDVNPLTWMTEGNIKPGVNPDLIDTSGITLRTIDVAFEIAGFRPMEPLKAVRFDGQPVAATPAAGGSLVADAQGVLHGKFTIPAGIPVGAKTVELEGEQGTIGRAQFVGAASVKLYVQATANLAWGARSAVHTTLTYVI